MTLTFSITLLAVALFFLFLTLTVFEKKQGRRVAGKLRSAFDADVSKVLFIFHHVDWSAFFRETVIHTLESMAHRAAHQTLLAVRGVEKFLSKTVARLRERRLRSLAQPRGRTIRSLRGVRMHVPVAAVETKGDIMVESEEAVTQPENGS